MVADPNPPGGGGGGGGGGGVEGKGGGGQATLRPALFKSCRFKMFFSEVLLL